MVSNARMNTLAGNGKLKGEIWDQDCADRDYS